MHSTRHLLRSRLVNHTHDPQNVGAQMPVPALAGIAPRLSTGTAGPSSLKPANRTDYELPPPKLHTRTIPMASLPPRSAAIPVCPPVQTSECAAQEVMCSHADRGQILLPRDRVSAGLPRISLPVVQYRGPLGVCCTFRAHTLPMTTSWNPIDGPSLAQLLSLRDSLAASYTTQAAALLVCQRAGLEVALYPWVDQPREFWHQIVQEAINHDRICHLVAAALQDHPGNRKLQKFQRRNCSSSSEADELPG